MMPMKITGSHVSAKSLMRSQRLVVLGYDGGAIGSAFGSAEVDESVCGCSPVPFASPRVGAAPVGLASVLGAAGASLPGSRTDAEPAPAARAPAGGVRA